MTSNSDEEPDFMSDEFLAQCTKNDVRPGLLFSQTEKRKHDLLKKQELNNALNAERNKSTKRLQEEGIAQGLQKQLGTENKGFQLLQKMGYKPGTSIGKSNTGILEPITISLKKTRSGLGEEEERERKRRRVEAEHMERVQALQDPTEYRARIQANKSLKETETDIRSAQVACQTLDLRNNKDAPVEPWYWPPVPVAKSSSKAKDDYAEDEPEPSNAVVEVEPSETDSDSDDDDEPPESALEPTQTLQILVEYLRTTYFYCIWCGTSFEDSDDLGDVCPGRTRQDH